MIMNKIVNGVANDFEFDMPPISAYGSINIDELKQVMERLKKIPNYDELIKDNNKKDKEIQRLNNIIDELEKYLYTICIGEATFEERGITQSIIQRLKELKEGK